MGLNSKVPIRHPTDHSTLQMPTISPSKEPISHSSTLWILLICTIGFLLFKRKTRELPKSKPSLQVTEPSTKQVLQTRVLQSSARNTSANPSGGKINQLNSVNQLRIDIEQRFQEKR
ncbi:hypothetical protein WICPIJ_003474 [Wickerhamomyces pijperi]|uniref:Uncharacterized protein n=1 Tax=Wickerhamomyces pijperi TaxID=599730 RepID=A0A9P8TMZ2_WICPI|nr:hypothetical protein WICPIJ_003474 [Wickerhamomyces pijperi]